MAYVIGSDKGKKIAEEMKTGETYQASDGSTWTKKSDGSVSVKTSAGETFDNAYSSPTSYNPYTKGNYSIGSDYGKQVAQNMGIGQQWTATDGSLWTKQNDGTITVDHGGVITNNAWTPSDYSTLAQQQIAAGVPVEYLQNTMYNREDKINSDPSLEKYRYDSTYWMMQNYIQDQMKKGNQQEAQDMFNQWVQEYEQNNPKQEYSGKYDARIDALLNEILTRDDFSYDAASDPLYQQYAQMYQREGERAMKNTLAEAAAGAGGMNTYAITAAQQANSYYNSQLNDKIPELYQLAYDMYLNDKESMVQDLGILQNMDATQYNRYRDTINDWYNDKNFAYGAYYDAIQQGNWQTNYDYNAMVDNRDFAQDYKDFLYEDSWRNKEWDANRADVEYEKTQYDRETAEGRANNLISLGEMPDDNLIAQAGLDKAYVTQMVNATRRKLGLLPISSSGSSSTGSSSTSSSSTQKKVADTGNDKPKETEKKTTETTEVKDVSSTTKLGLGLGPISDTTLEQLALSGAVVVKNDGTVQWANGYNKNNYQEALNKLHTQKSYPTLLW